MVVFIVYKCYNETKNEKRLIKESMEKFAMKEKYVEPIIGLIVLAQEDILTFSIEKGDNTLDDSFFD